MNRAFYSSPISDFISKDPSHILDSLSGKAAAAGVPPLDSQLEAWRIQIDILKETLAGRDGTVYFEFSIPRMGRRIDVVIIIAHVLFVLEFKVGQSRYTGQAYDQVWDYALDLKNFHEPSHKCPIVPVLIPTQAQDADFELKDTLGDRLFAPIKTSPSGLSALIDCALA